WRRWEHRSAQDQQKHVSRGSHFEPGSGALANGGASARMGATSRQPSLDDPGDTLKKGTGSEPFARCLSPFFNGLLGLDLDLADACGFRLRKRNRQHTLLAGGFDLVGVDAAREGHRPLEAAATAFDPMIRFALVLLLFLPL